ncbi:MAG: hypothetical protein K6E83_08930 [Clostridium sp.]|nr:hypothetical protein [Clostridium sp.]
MEESLQRMNQEFRRNLYATYGLMGILIAGLFFAITKNLPLSVLFVVAALVYQLGVIPALRRRYERMMNKENLQQTICRQLAGASLDETGGAGLTADMIAEAKLLPHFESGKFPFSAFKGVSGKDRKISVIAADVALNDTYTTLKGQSRGFANAGCWIHAEFAGNTGYDLRALGDGPLLINMEDDFAEKYPELVRISSGKAQVPDSLHVYAPEGAALPGPEFFRKLKNLAGYTTGEMWMSLRENHADFFIRNRFLAAKVNSRTAPTREMIALDPLPEFRRVLEILREV